MRNICPLLPHSCCCIFYTMWRIYLFALFYCLTLPSNVLAFDGIGVAVGVSATSGMELGVGYHNPYLSNIGSRFGVRANFSATDPLKSAIDSVLNRIMRDGVDVGAGVSVDDGKIDGWNTALLVDFYPMRGAWRLTGGYSWGGMTLDTGVYGTVANAPTDRFYFYLAGDHYFYNGNKFAGTTTIDWNYHGPYCGTGFDWTIACGFTMFLDFGAVITNRPAKLTISVPQEHLYIYNIENSTWNPVSIPKLDADIARATHEANRKLSDFRLFPMVKLGFGYRF